MPLQPFFDCFESLSLFDQLLFELVNFKELVVVLENFVLDVHFVLTVAELDGL
jgi:hypothetical protein